MTEQCLWTFDGDDCYFETACGSSWHYADGSDCPDEHGQYYCHRCGTPIEVSRKGEEE